MSLQEQELGVILHKSIEEGMRVLRQNYSGYAPADANTLLIEQFSRSLKIHFVILGGLLCECADNAHWTQDNKWDSFSDFAESLGVGSYTTITRMMQVYRVATSQQLTLAEIIEIGRSKMYYLVPILRKGGMSDEVKAIALTGTVKSLREELGHKVVESIHREVHCPNCGALVPNAKYTQKGD